jgi:hypothetical protein
MKVQELLARRKTAILKRWLNKILETYPPDTSKFLKNVRDPFANPVGNTISQGIEGLYEGLVEGTTSEEASSFLDHIIRIRAIQEFSPSEAVGFVFFLRDAIREELKKEIRGGHISHDLSALDSRIDELALLSFDIYMKCREKLYELRSNELRNRTIKLLERSDYVSGVSEEDGDSESGNNNGST